MTRRNSVSSGQRLSIPAGEYNSLLALLRRDADIATRDGREPFDNTKVWVRNNGATAKARWEPIGISEAIGIDPAQDSDANFDAVLLNGEVPDSDKHKGKFGICYDPIAPGKIGRVVIAGTTWAKLSISSSYDWRAEIKDNVGSYLETRGAGSAHILWKQSGTGPGKYGLVRLGPPPLRYYMAGAAQTISVSSVSTTQQSITSFFEVDGDDAASPARFSLATGILTFSGSGGYYNIAMMVNNLRIGYRRNDTCNISVGLEGRTNSGAAWGSALGLYVREHVYHPDVAVGASGSENSVSIREATALMHYASDGYQYRIMTTGGVYSTFPGVSVDSVGFTFQHVG